MTPPLTEARKRATTKYNEKNLKKMTFAFNIKTDADVLHLLEASTNKRQLVLTALREYAENHKENQPL